MAQLKDTTVSGDLNVSGDALIQGDAKVNSITTKEGTTINSNIQAEGDITTSFANYQTSWNRKTFNSLAGFINDTLLPLFDRIFTFFTNIDNSSKVIRISKKIDATVLGTTILYTVPSGYIAMGANYYSSSLPFCVIYAGNSNSYSDIGYTIQHIDDVAIKQGAPAGYKYTVNGILSHGYDNIGTMSAGRAAGAGDITFEITQALTYSSPLTQKYIYVCIEFMLFPNNN